MSAPTGAAALLALLTSPGARAIEREGIQFMPPETSPARCVVNARRSLRNALRRLVRAHGGCVGSAAVALGVSSSVLRAGARAVGLRLPSRAGRPDDALSVSYGAKYEQGSP